MASVLLHSTLLLLFSSLAVAQTFSYTFPEFIEFIVFKLQTNKTYRNGDEWAFRFMIFTENKNQIARHNAHYEKGLVSFELGLNPYADMLHHEFAKTVNGFNHTLFKIMKQQRRDDTATFMTLMYAEVDDEVDWRKEGAVTGVKNQGSCGSCWAFSSTGSLEGQHFRKTGRLIPLSEQQLIDCSHKYGNNGCRGGLMDNAFLYVKDNGIDTEEYYPYEARDNTCRFIPPAFGPTVREFHDIPEGDENALKQAVGTIGPISVAIDASQPSLQLYKRGVYYDDNCSSEQLNHAVLVIGYGTTEKGEDYWLVKNSWGEDWGEDGFIKMARNRDNHCGIASSASYPVV